MKQANIIARKNGHSRATKIIQDKRFALGNGKVIESTPFGYRKYTTGEYVPNSYRNNFGWKNTYYQDAVCIIRGNFAGE